VACLVPAPQTAHSEEEAAGTAAAFVLVLLVLAPASVKQPSPSCPS